MLPRTLPAGLSHLGPVLALTAGLLVATGHLRAADGFLVEESTVADHKAVFASVQSADVVPARARIGGTVMELTAAEGDAVKAGERIATIVDDKLALRIQGLEASIRGLQSAVNNAETELKRAEELKSRGIVSQARLDQIQTTYDVAHNRLQTAQAEKMVAEQQVAEGAVEAPGAGRVLSVPVTIGTVVLPGETIAEIASDRYILRLEVPERHARYIKLGDEVLIGTRGLDVADDSVGKGRIVTVYPRLQNGRVVADAEVSGLGDYFVGERALVRIAAGERRAIVIPSAYVFKRYGLDYVRVEGEEGTPLDVVVQLGQQVSDGEPNTVEVLGGLNAGDRLVRP
ncbi:efflux RND transporter periplasmic adaptor subunit [Microbaculum marinum]|uniref:Efflux RND transporter periplasmic adaptor subunit n=1 Tax=Microbaculum marinum TaxID=1764581 RepID=A0AAW9RYF4_9HYPH